MRFSLPVTHRGPSRCSCRGPTADAATDPCVAGGAAAPTCTVWQARIAVVDDGDTVQARIKQGGTLAPRQAVRINGLQAMEIHNYSHSQVARRLPLARGLAHRLEQLIGGKMVRLTAQKRGSTTTGEGGRDAPAPLDRGQAWRSGVVDVGAIMLAEGHALWLPNGAEWASNGVYSRIAQRRPRGEGGSGTPLPAAAAGRHARAACTLKLKWNAEDDDRRNINGEWIRITNTGELPVAVAAGSCATHTSADRATGRRRAVASCSRATRSCRPAPRSRSMSAGAQQRDDLYLGLGETHLRERHERRRRPRRRRVPLRPAWKSACVLDVPVPRRELHRPAGGQGST